MFHRTSPRGPSQGFVLLHDYLVPLCLTPSQLAEAINTPTSTVNEILDGGQASPMLCDRLARYFGTTPNFWRDMQRKAN